MALPGPGRAGRRARDGARLEGVVDDDRGEALAAVGAELVLGLHDHAQCLGQLQVRVGEHVHLARADQAPVNTGAAATLCSNAARL